MTANNNKNLGTCGLCRSSQIELKDSHLLPKGFYKRITKTDGTPYIITANKAVRTSKQVTNYFLCGTCEERFNRLGEDWTLKNCLLENGRFPIQERLLNTPPLLKQETGAYYVGNTIHGIDINQLCYFALSVFWRSAAHKWRLFDEIKKLEFGKYEELLRQYLLCEQPFPQKCGLYIYVSSDARQLGHHSFPYTMKLGSGRQYAFSVPGMLFILNLGGTLAEELQDFCAINSANRPLVLTSIVNEIALKNARLMAKAVAHKR